MDFPYKKGQPVEIHHNDEWKRGVIMDTCRFRDRTVTIRTETGEQIVCGEVRHDLYRPVEKDKILTQKIITIDRYQQFSYSNSNNFQDTVQRYLDDGFKISSSNCASVMHNFGGWDGGKPLCEKECIHYCAVLVKD